jgi:hypothetical protein
MNDQTSIPAPRDLPSGRLEARAQHLLLEIAREPRERHAGLPTPSRLRPRLALPAVGAVLCLALGGVLLGSTLSRPDGRRNGGSRNVAPRHDVAKAKQEDRVSPVAKGLAGAVAPPTSFPKRRIRLAEASRILAARVVLPNTSFLKPADAGAVWAIGSCPVRGQVAGKRSSATCWVWVMFPAESLHIAYRRAVYAHPLAVYRSYLRDKGVDGEIVELGKTPALLIKSTPPGQPVSHSLTWISFVSGGLEVDIVSRQRDSSLKAVAQSIAK